MQMRDFVVRFAGEGGQGVVTSAEGLGSIVNPSGLPCADLRHFPFADSGRSDLDASPNSR